MCRYHRKLQGVSGNRKLFFFLKCLPKSIPSISHILKLPVEPWTEWNTGYRIQNTGYSIQHTAYSIQEYIFYKLNAYELKKNTDTWINFFQIFPVMNICLNIQFYLYLSPRNTPKVTFIHLFFHIIYIYVHTTICNTS